MAANIKSLKLQIKSIESTQKITKAMKMVAASKLRHAQEANEKGRPFFKAFSSFYNKNETSEKPKNPIVVLITSDKGLCGGINTTIVKKAKSIIDQEEKNGSKTQLFIIGNKGRDGLIRTHKSHFNTTVTEIGKKTITFTDAVHISELLINTNFNGCQIFYNRFKSVIASEIEQNILFSYETMLNNMPDLDNYEFESDKLSILQSFFEYSVALTIYNALIENNASEQSARMTAMENATNNAGDMLEKLMLTYNITRQAGITGELIEIISGANAISE